VLFTIIDRKSRNNRVRKITDPVELSLLQLRDQALSLQNRVRNSVAGRVAPHPDPDWIQIQSGQWIRIRIRNLDPDPDPGGQK
jgi:hypothetical protein